MLAVVKQQPGQLSNVSSLAPLPHNKCAIFVPMPARSRYLSVPSPIWPVAPPIWPVPPVTFAAPQPAVLQVGPLPAAHWLEPDFHGSPPAVAKCLDDSLSCAGRFSFCCLACAGHLSFDPSLVSTHPGGCLVVSSAALLFSSSVVSLRCPLPPPVAVVGAVVSEDQAVRQNRAHQPEPDIKHNLGLNVVGKPSNSKSLLQASSAIGSCCSAIRAGSSAPLLLATTWPSIQFGKKTADQRRNHCRWARVLLRTLQPGCEQVQRVTVPTVDSPCRVVLSCCPRLEPQLAPGFTALLQMVGG